MNDYWNSEHHKTWVKLANCDYHGQVDGWLVYIVDENDKLKLVYVKKEL